MKQGLFFLSVFIWVTACNSDNKSMRQFNAIDFSYFDASPEAFFLRVTREDSVFVQQYFSSDSEGHLKDRKTYFSILKGDIKQQFDSLINVIDISRLNTVYETGHIDGDEYRLYFEGNTMTKQLYVHSMRPPKELEYLKKLFLQMKGSLAFVPLDTIINFRTNLPQTPPLVGDSSR